MAARTRYDAVSGTTLTATNLDKHAGGWVARITSTGATGSITTTETDISLLTETFTAESTRIYKVTVSVELTSNVANDVGIVKVTDGSNVEKHRHTGPIIIANTNETWSWSFLETGLSGSIARKVRAVRASGTGSFTVGGSVGTPSMLLVEDIGPSS